MLKLIYDVDFEECWKCDKELGMYFGKAIKCLLKTAFVKLIGKPNLQMFKKKINSDAKSNKPLSLYGSYSVSSFFFVFYI